ncbi:MAG: hypothetical protein AABZ06_05505 [Bdellovibrionota bacterium]
MKFTKKIKYGSIEIPDESFHTKKVKIRVTTFVDLDVLEELKRRAASENIGYQTFLNRILRQTIFEEKKIEDRVIALEKIVYKERAG